MFSCVLAIVLLIVAVPYVWADIFEYERPSDIDLREAINDDRSQFYVSMPGVIFERQEKIGSSIKKLSVDAFLRQVALRDTETSFDKYLKKELISGQIPKNDLSSTHPLVLLEYSSPVLADVIKHYRMSAFERLGLEQARLAQMERATETRLDRLSRQSERECLKRNADKGLVEAMRVCSRATDAFDALVSVDGATSLADGRRRIHVLKQALQRLGVKPSVMDDIVSIAGDVVVFDSGYEDYLPEKSFDGVVHEQRLKLMKTFEDSLEKCRAHRNVGVASLEVLSLPGSVVSERTFSDLKMLDEVHVKSAMLKLASMVSMYNAVIRYNQAAYYLDLCDRDPALSEEFRRIVLEKKMYLKNALLGRDVLKDVVLMHHEVLASLAKAADHARGSLLDE